MTLAAGSTLGPYEVVELLGAGGMGEVYRARDPRLGRDVAVKVLPEEVAGDAQRLGFFEREARAVAALNHPNILTVHDVGTHDGVPYVVTELLEGENFRELVSRRSPTVKQVLGYALQAARGLEAAHAKDIVHRDLKPENLFLTTDGRVKVLDFGLAKLVRREDMTTDAPTPSRSTAAGQVVGTVAYMSPEQARGHPVDPRSDVFSFGVVLYELLGGKHPFHRETMAATLTAIVEETPAVLEGLGRGIPPAVGGIVRRCLEKGREERHGSGHDVVVALEAVLQAPTGAAALLEVEERSPYPGLSSFTEKDAGVFFGREREVEELWGRIRNRRLLAVIGPSGAGKTSFVRAGVVASRPEGWAAVYATPGSNPSLGFARGLTPDLAGDPEAISELLTGVVEFSQTGAAERVVKTAKRWRSRYAEALLVMDQFEELFTLNPPEMQERFAALLGRLASEADVHVLLSLRDDFLIRCCEQPPLVPVLRDLTALMSLGREDLRRALVEPAKKQGYRFEDETLVEEMVSLVEGNRGALPLLAFAVARLWEKRDRERRLLTREAYQEIAGVEGALAQHAEATMDRIGSERQGVVRDLFRNLVTAQGTRAVIDRDELLSALPDRGAAEEVLRELIDARLLTSYEVEGKEDEPSRHRIEIIHESLLKAWPRLVRWQIQDEDGAQLRDQMRQAARLWDERGRSADLLWSGAAYREFEVWRERYPGGLTETEDAFARGMATHAEGKRRRRRLAVASLVVFLIAVVGVVGGLWRRAVSEAQRAEASKLLALAQLRLEEDPTEALAYTTASLGLADSAEARAFAMKALWAAPPALEERFTEYVRIPSFSPDGKQLAVAGTSDSVLVWSEDGAGPLALGGHGATNRPAAAYWTGDGLLVSGLWPGIPQRVNVWSFPEARRLRTVEFGAPTYWEVGTRHVFAETPEDGATEGRDVRLLRRWRLPGGEAEVLGRVDRTALGASSSTFVPNGQGWLYTKGPAIHLRPLPATDGSRDRLVGRHDADAALSGYNSDTAKRFSQDSSGEIRMWSFPSDGPELDRVIPRPATAPGYLRPEAGGRWVRGPADKNLRLWDTTAWPGARPLSLRRSGDWFQTSAAFHPRGDWIVAARPTPSRLTFWPLRGSYPTVVDGYARPRRPLAFSPDGRWLATVWSGRQVRLWPLPGNDGGRIRHLALPEGATWATLVFDPKGRYLIAVTGGRASIVPLDGSSPRKLEGFSDDTELAAVSPSGRLVASATFFREGRKALRVWELESGEERVFDLPEPEDAARTAGDRSASVTSYGVGDLHFADESTLFTAGRGGIRRWDLRSGAHEVVVAKEPNVMTYMKPLDEGRALTYDTHLEEGSCRPAVVRDLSTGASRPLPGFGDCVRFMWALVGAGTLAATGDDEGVVRVGRVSGGEPHLLFGHEGPVDYVAVSPDLRWVATSGEDDTLRLWPMPDLSEPPLHTLPHAELLEKLRSLTNLKVVRDPEAPSDWKVELGPFPGWKDVPTW